MQSLVAAVPSGSQVESRGVSRRRDNSDHSVSAEASGHWLQIVAKSLLRCRKIWLSETESLG